jgi:hypothetical protein
VPIFHDAVPHNRLTMIFSLVVCILCWKKTFHSTYIDWCAQERSERGHIFILQYLSPNQFHNLLKRLFMTNNIAMCPTSQDTGLVSKCTDFVVEGQAYCACSRALNYFESVNETGAVELQAALLGQNSWTSPLTGYCSPYTYL